MKKEIKLSIVALVGFFMVSFSANAQKKASIGIKAEANTTYYIYSAETEYSNSTPGLGGGAGLTFKYDFKNWFALQTDLMLQYRTSKMENELTNEKSTLKTIDLELPVYAVFQGNLGAGKIFFGLGGYMGYGISAKDGELNMYKKDATGKAPMEQLYYGATAMLGYNFGHFQIYTSYLAQAGIGEIRSNSDLRRQSFSLGIGFSL